MESNGFDLIDRGEGQTVLMLPGSYATPAAWKGIQEATAGAFRFVSTSLPGYGTTPERRPENDNDIGHLVAFVEEVIDALAEPVHLVGHSWGAHLALAALLSGRIAPLSLLCFEANPIFARPAAGPFPWRADVDAMVERFDAALAEDDPEAAAIIIDFYSHEGAFRKMPEPVRAFCQATARTNLRDWYSAQSFSPWFDEFAALDLPVTLVRGSETPVPIVDVTDQLAEQIPGAKVEVVQGADHFLISTHPKTCAELIKAHIAIT